MPGASSHGAFSYVSSSYLSTLGSIQAVNLSHATAVADSPSPHDLNDKFVMEDDKEYPTKLCAINRVGQVRKAKDICLATIAVITRSHGRLVKLAIFDNCPTRGVSEQGFSAAARGNPKQGSAELYLPKSLEAPLQHHGHPQLCVGWLGVDGGLLHRLPNDAAIFLAPTLGSTLAPVQARAPASRTSGGQ